jgi:hypothetical protein
MIITIIYLMAIASGVAIIQSQDWYDNLLLKLYLYRRPFNCSICMGYWSSFIFLMITSTFINALLLSFLTAIASEMIYRKIINMI